MENGNHGNFKIFPLPTEQIPTNESIGELEGLLVWAAWVRWMNGNANKLGVKHVS